MTFVVLLLLTHNCLSLRIRVYHQTVGVLQTAIDSAQSHGILFVASAGNDGLDTDVTAHYPSSMNNTNVLSVGASDDTDDLWTESNYGKTTVQVTTCNVKQLFCSLHFAFVVVYQCVLTWFLHNCQPPLCACVAAVSDSMVCSKSCTISHHV